MNEMDTYITLHGLKRFVDTNGLSDEVAKFMQLDDTYTELFNFNSAEDFIESVDIQIEGLVKFFKKLKADRIKKKEELLKKENSKKEMAAKIATFPSDYDEKEYTYWYYWFFENHIDKITSVDALKEYSKLNIPFGIDRSCIAGLKKFADEYQALLDLTVKKMEELDGKVYIDGYGEERGEYFKWLDNHLKKLKIKGFKPYDFGILDTFSFSKKSTVGKLGWDNPDNLKTTFKEFYTILDDIASLGSAYNEAYGRYQNAAKFADDEHDYTRELIGGVYYNWHGVDDDLAIPFQPLLTAMDKSLSK